MEPSQGMVGLGGWDRIAGGPLQSQPARKTRTCDVWLILGSPDTLSLVPRWKQPPCSWSPELQPPLPTVSLGSATTRTRCCHCLAFSSWVPQACSAWLIPCPSLHAKFLLPSQWQVSAFPPSNISRLHHCFSRLLLTPVLPSGIPITAQFGIATQLAETIPIPSSEALVNLQGALAPGSTSQGCCSWIMAMLTLPAALLPSRFPPSFSSPGHVSPLCQQDDYRNHVPDLKGSW